MLIGCYGDVHLNKNMRSLQDIWNVTASKSIHHMYNRFDELNVELAVCLGDMFDVPRLEAKHLNLVLPILQDINSRSYPTYILLGNHEADSEESNILEYLSVYENIHPVTTMCTIEDLHFIPYYEKIEELELPKDKIIFTHHDIYGSELASGKTKAFFGVDPRLFEGTKLVMNGHVHLKSKICTNVINAGSLLTSQQGELKVGDYPSYYILDTRLAQYTEYKNEHSMIYLSIDKSEVDKVKDYISSHLVLRVDYNDEIPETFINTAHTSWRKTVDSITSQEEEIVHVSSNFDMKNYLTDYIKKDQEVSSDNREDYIATGLELLS